MEARQGEHGPPKPTGNPAFRRREALRDLGSCLKGLSRQGGEISVGFADGDSLCFCKPKSDRAFKAEQTCVSGAALQFKQATAPLIQQPPVNEWDGAPRRKRGAGDTAPLDGSHTFD